MGNSQSIPYSIEQIPDYTILEIFETDDRI